MEFVIEKYLLALASAIYLSGLGLTLCRFKQKKPPLSNINFAIICVGLLVQSIGLYLRGLEAGSCPIRDPFEVLQFISWSTVVLYILSGAVFRISFFGTTSAAIAAILSAISFINPQWDVTDRTHVFGDNLWIEAHAALSLFSYGIFALLAAISILYQIQNYSLKKKTYPSFFKYLPSITEMDAVLFRLLLSAWIVFTTAILIGTVHWISHFEEVSKLKLLFANSLWLAYTLILILRLTHKINGTKLASSSLALFLFAIMTLYPVESDRFEELVDQQTLESDR